MRSINPTRTKDQIPPPGLTYEMLTLQLGEAVPVQGTRPIRFPPRGRLTAVKDIICGIGNEECASLSAGTRQHARSSRIDRHCQIRLRLCLVDRRVCCCQHYHRRLLTQDLPGNLVWMDQIGLTAVPCDYLSISSKTALQFRSDLAGRSKNQGLPRGHQAKTSASASLFPLASLAETMASASLMGHSMPISGSFQRMVRSPAGE